MLKITYLFFLTLQLPWDPSLLYTYLKRYHICEVKHQGSEEFPGNGGRVGGEAHVNNLLMGCGWHWRFSISFSLSLCFSQYLLLPSDWSQNHTSLFSLSNKELQICSTISSSIFSNCYLGIWKAFEISHGSMIIGSIFPMVAFGRQAA